MLILALKISAIYSFTLAAFWFLAKELAPKHGGDVRILTYLFSLSTVVTLVLAAGAMHFGAIDVHGNFSGVAGKQLQSLLHAMLDLPTDLAILLAIAIVALVPQFLSYLLSGLFGCARAPILVGPILKVLFWLAVKSLATAGGIILALTIFGAIQGWAGVATSKGFVLAYFGFAMLIMALAYVFVYRSFPNKVKLHPKLVWLRSIDKWFNRATRSRT